MTSYGLQEILTIILMMLYPVAWAVVVYAVYRTIRRLTDPRR